MAKYTIIAYLLWVILGWIGAHLFYLGRDFQGILWLTSFGGWFGIGWLRDFYKIPAYVKESNEDQGYMMQMVLIMRQRRRPSIWANIHRVIAQVAFGSFYRYLVLYSLPEEYSVNSFVVLLLVPLGTTLGTYMVSNIGMIKSPLKYSLIGAYVGEIILGYSHCLLEESHPSLAVSISMLFSTFAWEFDRRPRAQSMILGRRRTCCKRFLTVIFALFIFGSLLCSAIYFNAAVTTNEGETVKVREAVNNFFKSPYWKKLKESFWKSMNDIWQEYKKKGWKGARSRIVILADIQGEERSRVILGVESNATMKELKARYRLLAKEWHPDHHHSASAEEKAEVQERFMEIQEAYENLQRIFKKREYRSQRSKSHS